MTAFLTDVLTLEASVNNPLQVFVRVVGWAFLNHEFALVTSKGTIRTNHSALFSKLLCELAIYTRRCALVPADPHSIHASWAGALPLSE